MHDLPAVDRDWFGDKDNRRVVEDGGGVVRIHGARRESQAATADSAIGQLNQSLDAVVVPEGFNGTDVVKVAAEKYGMAFGVGLGEVAGKVFRIGHLGSLTDAMMLSGLATAEMCMADLGYPITLGTGVAAAQDYYRKSAGEAAKAAA